MRAAAYGPPPAEVEGRRALRVYVSVLAPLSFWLRFEQARAPYIATFCRHALREPWRPGRAVAPDVTTFCALCVQARVQRRRNLQAPDLSDASALQVWNAF